MQPHDWGTGIGVRACKEDAQTEKTPVGKLHLHLVPVKGRPEWVVRHRNGVLCKTRRCRLVIIYIYEGGE